MHIQFNKRYGYCPDGIHPVFFDKDQVIETEDLRLIEAAVDQDSAAVQVEEPQEEEIIDDDDDGSVDVHDKDDKPKGKKKGKR